MKKFLAILLTLAVVLGLCACGGGGGKEDEVDMKHFTIGLPSNAMVTSFTDNSLTKWVQEQTGYTLEFVEFSGGTDMATQISTTVAARQELPDILYSVDIGDAPVFTYGRDGYFVDLTDYFNDKEGASKNFWDRVETLLTEEQQSVVMNTIQDPDNDNHIYSVPTIETSLIDSRYYQPWINRTWLDRLGLDMPTNTQQLYDVLVAFNTKDPDGNGDPHNEIPLLGAEREPMGGQVIDWLINMFIYYHYDRKWQPDENGTLQYVYTQDAYREALKFIHKLYEEELLSNMVYTATNTEIKAIATPTAGDPMVGIFVGHLTLCTNADSTEILKQYEALPLWGKGFIERDVGCRMKAFITSDCDNPDGAFEILMLLFSEEGSLRTRYGEYGKDWTDADEGAVSDLGLPAKYKVLNDTQSTRHSANWGQYASCFNWYAEGEEAQMSDNVSEYIALKQKLHGDSYRLFAEAAKGNPEVVCPVLVATSEEKEMTDNQRTAVTDYVNRMETNFITGIGDQCDIDKDADWNTYLAKINELGFEDFQGHVQMCYDRQVNAA